jgi:uncharacterized protein (DUF4415 family)
MKRKRRPVLIDEENPEWTAKDFRRARPAREVLPKLIGKKASAELLRRRGRPKAPVTKTQITLRLSPEVVAHFKRGGAGWQTRMNDALKRLVRKRAA